MKKEIISLLGQLAGMQVSEKDTMGFLFKNLRMLLTDVDMYLKENLGITLSEHEKDMLMSMSVNEFLGFLQRKIKERDMQTIADILRRVGAVKPSTYVDAQDRIYNLLDLSDEGLVSRFLVAIEVDFNVKPSDEENAKILRMTLSELADFLNKIK